MCDGSSGGDRTTGADTRSRTVSAAVSPNHRRPAVPTAKREDADPTMKPSSNWRPRLWLRYAPNEPDTLLYVLTKDPERDHTFVWIERYRDQQALARHSEAPYMADALAKLPGWWSSPPEMVQLRQIVSI